MKIMIASDVHGSSYYARLMADRFREEGADQLVLLGDIYNPGPRNPISDGYAPMQVADILNGLKDRLMVVKGNCDSQVDTLISEFHFADEAQLYVDGKKITLTHGHVFNKDNIPPACGDALIYGHFHTGFIFRSKDTVIANAGSVSLPKDGTAHSYLILEDGVLTLKDVTSGAVIESMRI